MYGYVYKTINLINGKIYIGQHLSESWDAKYKGSGTMLKRAFDKYGKDNFKCELIKECSNQEELDNSEIYFIEYYDALNTSVGYNIAKGGVGGSHPAWNGGLTKSDPRVMKYTLKRKETYKGNFGSKNGKCIKAEKHLQEILPEFEAYWNTHFTQEVYSHFHIGKKLYNKCLELLELDFEARDNFLKQRKYEEWYNGMITNNQTFNAHKIRCIETGEVFNSILEARNALGLKSSSALYNALKNPSKTCREYHWEKIV